MRNLDLTALRSFVMVAEAGGVTRAAGLVNLTQSAVSMQLRRLEEMLQTRLVEKAGRGLALTSDGEQLLGYARRMLAVNDEAMARLSQAQHQGEISLGVPPDLIYPVVPQVLGVMAQRFPKVKITLVSAITHQLRAMFAQGKCDLVLATEDACAPEGRPLGQLRLNWIGAPGGAAWRKRPLRLAFSSRCAFRPGVQAALDAAGIPWEMAIESDQWQTIEAGVTADLAVYAMLEGTEPAVFERIDHRGGLPGLGGVGVNLYQAPGPADPARAELAQHLALGFARLAGEGQAVAA